MTSGRGRLTPRTAFVFIICLVVLAIICQLGAAIHGSWYQRFLWLALGFAIGTVCHELGHLLGAAIASIPIRLTVVGVGPLLWRRRFGETSFELRLLPYSGFVSTYPVVNSRWYCWVLFLLGGVLGNVAVICLVAGLDAVGAAPEQAGESFGPVVFIQLYLIVVNLFPFRARVGGTRMPTDGLQLLQLLWQSQNEAAQLRAAYATALSKYSNGNLQLTMSSVSSRILYHVACFQLATDEDRRRDFRETLLRELEGGDLVREEKMWMLDALVTDGLISGDPAVRARLDEWSLQALELGPELPTLLGTRGAVLVELGRYEAGKTLLAPLAAANQARPYDSLMSQAFLARAERALGNEAAARQFANAAHTIAEAISATPRVMAMLARHETEMQPVRLR